IVDHHWESAILKYAVARDDGDHSGPLTWIKEGVIHITPVGFESDMAKAMKALESEVAARNLSPERRARLCAGPKEKTARATSLLCRRLGWMPRVHPVALPSGRWILPLYSDTFDGSIMAISDDRGTTWTTSGSMLGFGNIQAALVRKDDGTLVAFMRENGGRG